MKRERGNVSETANTLIFWAALVTIGAVFPMPYVYYTGLRLFFFVALLWLSWQLIRMGRWSLLWLCACIPLLLLYNPLLPVHLGNKLLWTVFNIATVGTIWGIASAIAKRYARGQSS